MLKKGFTLQELLITMGIVGIISALVIPGVVNMMPDKNKTMYVKAYNTLTNETADILSDESLFWDTNFNVDAYEEFGLYSTEQPQIEPYSSDDNCKGETKFPAILSHRLNIKGEPSYNGATTTFTTNDGINWNFETSEVSITGGAGLGYRIDVTINLDPSDNNASHNCLYSATCTKPNQFKFEIDNDGGVRAADALGIAYLQTPTDTHNSSKDREFAESIYADTVDAMYTKLNEKLKPSTTTETTTEF